MPHWLTLADYKHGYTVHVLEGIEAALKRVQEDYEDWPDPDFTNEPANHLVGLAFVAIQNYLTEVPLIVRESQSDPAVRVRPMNDLLHDFGSHVPGTTLRDMEAIWHFANYWKHCDEWDRDWVKEAASKPNSSGRTIDILRRLGFSEATNHLMLEGIERVVQIEWWTSLTPLLARASEWRVQALSGCGCTVRQADA